MEEYKKSPQNCGTKAADVLANSLAGKRQSTEYFGAFATTMTTQRLPIKSVAPSAAVWPQFIGEF